MEDGKMKEPRMGNNGEMVKWIEKRIRREGNFGKWYRSSVLVDIVAEGTK